MRLRNRSSSRALVIQIYKQRKRTMRGILLWLIGIPIPIILLLWLFGVLH